MQDYAHKTKVKINKQNNSNSLFFLRKEEIESVKTHHLLQFSK